MLAANKGGYAFAVDAEDGRKLWAQPVGKSQFSHPLLPPPKQMDSNDLVRNWPYTRVQADVDFSSSCYRALNTPF